MYTDGSYSQGAGDEIEKCGWGFTVHHHGGGAVEDACRPVPVGVEDGNLADLSRQLCADKLSNNVGELSAILMSLLCIARAARAQQICICYDSKYAAAMTIGRWKPKANTHLIAQFRKAFLLASARPEIQWRKIEFQTGDHMNDRADVLAKVSSRGTAQFPQQCVLPMASRRDGLAMQWDVALAA